MRGQRSCSAVGAVLLAVGVLSAAESWADAIIYVRSSGCSPSSVSINVGESAYFIAADENGPYCIQSTIGAWTPWYLWDYGEGFGLQFNQRGDYYYREIFYGNTGVIHVGTGTPNVVPTVTITSPTDGAVFTEPASFPFEAIVTDPDSGVAAVEFYVGGNLVDVIYGGLFSTQVTNLAAGSYTLTIVAYDNAAATTTRSINITVQSTTPPAITLSSPSLVAGQFQFEATGLTVGKEAVLQAAPSPGTSANWTSLQTNTVTSTTITFNQPALPGPRFFRVMQLP